MKRVVLALAVISSVLGLTLSLRTLAIEAAVPHGLRYDDLRLFGVNQAHSLPLVQTRTIGNWISDRSFVHQDYATCIAEKQDSISRKDLPALKRAWRSCIDTLHTALRRSPTDGRLWLELATAKSGLDGIDHEVTEALRMSYVTALREGWISKPRQKFAKAIWASLPAEVMKLVLEDDLDAAQQLALGTELLSISDSQGKGEALERLEVSATKDNPFALEKLGEIYLKGDGVPTDPAKAQAYLEKAIENGSTAAHLILGRALWKGDRLPKDRGRGLRLIENAAKTSHWAQEVLGNMLLSGELPRDVPRAVALLESAAKSGNRYALNKLGEIYLKGDGVPVDSTRARAFLEGAIEKGSTTAEVELGQALWNGDQLPRDKVKGLKLIERAAQTDAWGQFVLANMLLSGELPRDVQRALELLETSAENGNPYALEKLGVVYLRGDGVQPNASKALAYLEQAVKNGSIGARVTLGEALWKGDQLPQDRTRALQLLESAALTNSWGQLVLGRILLSEEHRDIPRALALLESSANLGNTLALEALAKIYETGNGVSADPAKAKIYLTRARASRTVE
jgi:TPR repeat protein